MTEQPNGMVTGKTAIVTGGASGLGEATCRLLVREGARVVVADIQAGIVGSVGPIDETPLDEWQFSIDVLLKSVFLGSKHAARVMKPQGFGVILSTSSVVGIQGGLGPHAYNMAKTAIVGFTKNLAAELGPFGVRANAIAPGKHNTPMNADVLFRRPRGPRTIAGVLRHEGDAVEGAPGSCRRHCRGRRVAHVGSGRVRQRAHVGGRRRPDHRIGGGSLAGQGQVRDPRADAARGRPSRPLTRHRDSDVTGADP